MVRLLGLPKRIQRDVNKIEQCTLSVEVDCNEEFEKFKRSVAGQRVESTIKKNLRKFVKVQKSSDRNE
jgi:hypothetical protein